MTEPTTEKPKQSLTQITDDLHRMMNEIDEIQTEGQEPNQELIDKLNDMVTNQAEKIDRTCSFIIKLQHDNIWLKDEKAKLDNVVKKNERIIQRLAERAREVMESEGVKKIEGLKGHYFSLRTSSYVNVACNADELPPKYINTTHAINSAAIKEDLKAGKEIYRCDIRTRTNVQVK